MRQLHIINACSLDAILGLVGLEGIATALMTHGKRLFPVARHLMARLAGQPAVYAPALVRVDCRAATGLQRGLKPQGLSLNRLGLWRSAGTGSVPGGRA